jgi:GAF domain-containing protein
MDDGEQTQLEQALASLTRLLFADETFESAVRRVVDLAVGVIPSCDSCSVSRVQGRTIETPVASDSLALDLDNLQYESGGGPCVEAIRTGSPVVLELRTDGTRWPAFVTAAARVGLHSARSLPLRVDSRVLGALNLYSLAGPFTDLDVRLSESFAEQAAITLANAEAYQRSQELVANLRIALESRDVIGQAKGIIMERERCTAEQAFDILRTISQTRNIKLRDLAQQVVETGTWTDAPRG